jgi:hypothetical protein
MKACLLKFAKARLASLVHEEEGALYEFLGLILFLALVLGLLVPLMIEVFIYNNQAQELDTLTKLAANRACSVMSKSSVGVAGDINQGSLGVGTDISVMQPLVNAVFTNQASHPETYFENTQDGKNIDLKIFDFIGKEIDTASESNWVTVEDSNGSAGKVLMVGTNTDAALCPAGGGSNWKYCMAEGSDDQAKQALIQNGQAVNQDLVARMEKLQPGRCQPGQDCSNDFKDRIERCSVCATKSRESIFDKSIFLGSVVFLACKNNPNKVTLLPCKMTACANSKFVQYSAKRGYAPKYRSQLALGQEFTAIENNPNAATEASKSSTPSQDLFCIMSKARSGIFDDTVEGACQQSGLTAPPLLVPPSIPSIPGAGSLGNIGGNSTGLLGNATDAIGNAASGVTGAVSSATGSTGNAIGAIGNATSGITNAVNGAVSEVTGGSASNSGSATNDSQLPAGGISGSGSGGVVVSNPELDAYNAQRTELAQAYIDAKTAINEAHKQHSIEITQNYRSLNKLGSPEHKAAVDESIAEQQAKLAKAESNYESAVQKLGPAPSSNPPSGASTGATTAPAGSR